MKNTIKTTITESTEHNFHQYDGQCQPQPAYIYCDTRTGEIWSGYNPEIGGGMIRDIWNGLIESWNIPVYLTVASINDTMLTFQDKIEQYINNPNDERYNFDSQFKDFTSGAELIHIVDDWAELYDYDIDTMCDVVSAKTAKEYDDAVVTDANDSIDNLHVTTDSTPSDALIEIIVNASMLADSEIARIIKTNRWLLSNDDVVSAIEDSDDSEGM